MHSFNRSPQSIMQPSACQSEREGSGPGTSGGMDLDVNSEDGGTDGMDLDEYSRGSSLITSSPFLITQHKGS